MFATEIRSFIGIEWFLCSICVLKKGILHYELHEIRACTYSIYFLESQSVSVVVNLLKATNQKFM